MLIGSFLAAVITISLAGLPGLWLSRESGRGEKLFLGLLVAGALTGAAAGLAALGQEPGAVPFVVRPGPDNGPLLELDGLSVLFLLPTMLISLLGAVYGQGYWPQARKPESGPRLRFFYGLLTGALALLLAARHGLLFLISWETMALAGYFLIITENEKKEVRKAGFLYLAATHTGTLALFALFSLLGQTAGSLAFPAAGTLTAAAPAATAIFLLGLLGFGLKAGLMPLHIWLPGAHAAAPTHVSALLSGVMIKMGIYGLIRVTSFFTAPPAWWGWTVLLLGVISGVMGVALAIAQHDVKRLLAYHSVENIGIIAMGFGLALLGRTFGTSALFMLGMGGALLHVLNHSLFKSLLFYSAGSVIQATGSREIDHYGGLLRRLPATGIFFLGGAVAICGLPPLNGFVSEWLIYLGLLATQQNSGAAVELAVFAAPALALIGGLALACFVKVFGITFLGSPRNTEGAAAAQEAPAVMLFPMGGLLLCCGWIGLLPGTVLPLLQTALAALAGPVAPAAFDVLVPARTVSRMAALLLLCLGVLGAFLKHGRRRADISVPTWDCGSGLAHPRLQYTGSSFGGSLVTLLHWGLRTRRRGRPSCGRASDPKSFISHTPDAVLDLFLLPLSRTAARLATRLRAMLQQGQLHVYLLYMALTLVSLLAFFMF